MKSLFVGYISFYSDVFLKFMGILYIF